MVLHFYYFTFSWMNNMKYNIFLKFQWEDEDKYQKMASIEDQNSNHIPQVWVEISRTKLKYYIMENVLKIQKMKYDTH